jgi:hypothetical protein
MMIARDLVQREFTVKVGLVCDFFACSASVLTAEFAEKGRRDRQELHITLHAGYPAAVRASRFSDALNYSTFRDGSFVLCCAQLCVPGIARAE